MPSPRDALTTADGIRDIAHEDARELRNRAAEVAMADTQRSDVISELLEKVSKVENKLTKQRKRIERAAAKPAARAAESADVGELVEVVQRDGERLHPAHRKTGHRAIRLIGKRAKVGVDVGNQLVAKHRLERTDVEVAQPPEADFIRHSIGHYNNK